MDQIDAFLDEKCGDDYAARDRMNMVAHKGPKGDRKTLNNYIVQAGRGGVNFLFCYRADEKVKPVKGQGIQNMGMTPETTSKLVYEMMAMFLLSAAADGKPITNPQTPLEKMFTKLPVQFRDMLEAGSPLSEDFGQRLAEWARGVPDKKAAINPVHETIKKALDAATAKLTTKEEKMARKAELVEKYFGVKTWPQLIELPTEKFENALLTMKSAEELL